MVKSTLRRTTCLLALLALGAAADAQYTAQPIVMNPGATVPHALNDFGTVAGRSDVLTPSFQPRAFVWDNGVARNLALLQKSGSAEAGAINNAGLVVGYATNGGYHNAVLWNSPTGAALNIKPKGSTNSGAGGINANGWIVGSASFKSRPQKAILWVPSAPNSSTFSITELPDWGAGAGAGAINDSNQVVGTATLPGAGYRAFVWSPGQSALTQLPSVGVEGFAAAINNAGLIAGHIRLPDMGSTNRAVVWEAGVMTELPTLGGIFSRAVGVNNQGDVVGVSETPEFAQRAVLWKKGPDGWTITDLNSVVSLPGVTLTWAFDINNAGSITVMESRGPDPSRAYLLTPAP